MRSSSPKAVTRFPAAPPDCTDLQFRPAIRFTECVYPSPLGPQGQPDICGVNPPPPLSSIPIPRGYEAAVELGIGCSEFVLRDSDSTTETQVTDSSGDLRVDGCSGPSRAE